MKAPSPSARPPMRKLRSLREFARDRAGATAVEFGLIGILFISLMLAIVQLGVTFLSQMNIHHALSDATTGNTANTFAGNRAGLAQQICRRLVMVDNCAANLVIEMQPLANFGAARQPIVGGAFAAVTAGVPMLLRARAPIITFVPGMPALSVSGAAVFARPS